MSWSRYYRDYSMTSNMTVALATGVADDHIYNIDMDWHTKHHDIACTSGASDQKL